MKVLVTEEINKIGIDILEKEGFELVLAKSSEKVIQDAIVDADAILVRIYPLDADLLKKAKNLKIISKHGVGVDNIDLKFCEENNIKLTRTPGANSLSVAEHAFTLMLALSKDLKIVADGYKEQGFKVKELYRASEVSNKTLGIIGLGAIGQKLAKLSMGFDMKLVAYDPWVDKEFENIEVLDSLDKVLEVSDFISIHCPLTKDTENLFSYKEFEKMKDNAIIINCARGGIINEADLVKALKNGIIKAAGLDVSKEEPLDKSSELFKLDNLIITPHFAASTEEASINVAKDAAINIVNFYKDLAI